MRDSIHSDSQLPPEAVLLLDPVSWFEKGISEAADSLRPLAEQVGLVYVNAYAIPMGVRGWTLRDSLSPTTHHT